MTWLLNLAVRRVVNLPPGKGESADWLRAKADVLLSVAESWERHCGRRA